VAVSSSRNKLQRKFSDILTGSVVFKEKPK